MRWFQKPHSHTVFFLSFVENIINCKDVSLWRSGKIDPRILTHGIICRRVVKSTPLPLWPQCPLNSRLCGLRSQCRSLGETMRLLFAAKQIAIPRPNNYSDYASPVKNGVKCVTSWWIGKKVKNGSCVIWGNVTMYIIFQKDVNTC